jgi:hypothetical protein
LASSIILAVKSVFDDAGLKKAQRDFGKVGKSLKSLEKEDKKRDKVVAVGKKAMKGKC